MDLLTGRRSRITVLRVFNLNSQLLELCRHLKQCLEHHAEQQIKDIIIIRVLAIFSLIYKGTIRFEKPGKICIRDRRA